MSVAAAVERAALSPGGVDAETLGPIALSTAEPDSGLDEEESSDFTASSTDVSRRVDSSGILRFRADTRSVLSVVAG